jgi:hypothetical protein
MRVEILNGRRHNSKTTLERMNRMMAKESDV